jgi:hypothetical protein
MPQDLWTVHDVIAFTRQQRRSGSSMSGEARNGTSNSASA